MHMRLSHTHRFNNDVFNFRQYLVLRLSSIIALNMRKHECERSLTTNIVPSFIVILYEIFTLFIDCIISQMHAKVVKVFRRGHLVWHGCKPR